MIYKSDFVHGRIGEKCLLFLITFGSLAITTVDIFLFESEVTYGKVGYNGCLGRSHEFQVRSLLLNLALIKWKTSCKTFLQHKFLLIAFLFLQKLLYEYNGFYAKENTPEMTFVVVVQTSALFAEFMCYLSINLYIYNHNKSMLQTAIINQDTYRCRQRSHAFTVTHHMYQFTAEFIYITLANLAIHIRSNRQSYFMLELLMVFKDMGFGILTFVQVLSSTEIRTGFLNSLKSD